MFALLHECLFNIFQDDKFGVLKVTMTLDSVKKIGINQNRNQQVKLLKIGDQPEICNQWVQNENFLKMHYFLLLYFPLKTHTKL